jgi:hypothetical protein
LTIEQAFSCLIHRPMTILWAVLLYLNGSKRLCEKSKLNPIEVVKSQSDKICVRKRWLRLSDLVGVGPRNP